MDSPVIRSPSTPKHKQSRTSPLPGATPSDMEQGAPSSTINRQDVLKGVVAYVEVRSGSDNRSRCIVKELTLLGAEIAPKFSQDVTHVIFKDGKKSTHDKAKKKGVHLVSVLWVDSCKRTQSRVAESLHEPVLTESIKTPILLGRHTKKTKSMQPKDFDEEVASSAERGKNKRRRQANADKWKILESPYSPHLPRIVYAAETQPRSPFSLDMSFSPAITVPDTPPSMRRKLQELREKRALIDRESESEAESPPVQDSLTPLQRRLFGSLNMGSRSSAPSSPDAPDTPVLNLAGLKSPKSDKKEDSGSDASDGSTSSKNGNKKHKLLNLDPGVLPPEDLLKPSKTTNGMQTKPTLISPKVDKRKGPRTKAVKRSRSSEEEADPPTSEQTVIDKTKSGVEKPAVKPRKRVRVTETELPRTASVTTEGIKPLPAGVLKLKKTSRRQSIASSTPSKAAGAPEALIKRRGRRSMAVVIPEVGSINDSPDPSTTEEPVSTTPGDDTTADNSLTNDSLDSSDIKVKRRGRRSMAQIKSSQERDVSPLVTNEDVFGESIPNDTVVEKKVLEPRTAEVIPEETPLVPPKVNRRRSVRIQNTSQLQTMRDDLSSQPFIPLPRKPRKSMVSTPIGEYGSQGKCPADLDSTADDSVLCLLPSKKKTFKSVGSAKKRRNSDNDDTFNGDKKTVQAKSMVPCLSHSRKSLEDFHPSQFLPSERKGTGASKNKDNLDSSCSGSDVSESKIKRKVKKSRSRPEKSSSSSDESGSKRSKDRPKATIVTTSMHFDEQDMVRNIIKSLTGYRVSSSVSDHTTHVICGDPRRTLNILYAISRGCWLLSKEWVMESLETGRWVDEEPYELHDYFPAAQASRLERMASESKDYCSGIFSESGHIFVADDTSPPHHHLVSLLKLNGGKVTQCNRKAELRVGSGLQLGNPTVSEQWVLDSIASHRCLPIDKYHIVETDPKRRARSPDF